MLSNATSQKYHTIGVNEVLARFLTNGNCKKNFPCFFLIKSNKFLQLPCCWSWWVPASMRFLSMILVISAGWIPQGTVQCLWPAEQVKLSSSPSLASIAGKKAEAFGHVAKDSFEIWSHHLMQFQCVWLCYKLFSFPPPMLWGAIEFSLNMPAVFDGKSCLQGATCWGR